MAAASRCMRELSDRMEARLLSSSERFRNDSIDVDAPPSGNNDVEQCHELLGHEVYIADIEDTYRRMENNLRPKEDYLAGQTELDEDMRWEVADWLIRAHCCLELTPEALYLSFYILDRYLSLQDVPAAQLHLVGVSALFIASKYQEQYRGLGMILDCSVDATLTEMMVVKKEKDILRKLQWDLSKPTPYEFMTMFLHAETRCVDEGMRCATWFFGELGLMDYSAVARPPSLRAASALYAARCTMGTEPLWPEELAQVTRYSEPQLVDAARSLLRLHADSEMRKPEAVYEKHASEDWKGFTSPPPATTLALEKKAKGKRSLVHRALRRCSKRIRSMGRTMPSCFK